MQHRPKKWLGQNFLRDVSVIDRIIASLALTPEDVVMEIGPGQGALTEALIGSGARVVAIEYDRDLIADLNRRFGSNPNFRLVAEDALEIDFAGLVDPAPIAKLVANLPYNISTPILQRLITHRHIFATLVLMFQREVVGRITARPGSSERGFLTVLVEAAFDVEHLFDVQPEAFYPSPKVWSSVVRLTPRSADGMITQSFRAVVSAAFAQKRKTLQNNLKGVLPNAAVVLHNAGIDPSRRAETLTLEEWLRLSATVESH